MNKSLSALYLVFTLFLFSCTASKNYSPAKKFSRQELQEDFLVLKGILETKHPSLYWYTGKDSMDYYFSKYYHSINDSMNEVQFTWQVLAPLVDKIHCGHTSASMSRSYSRWVKGKRLPSFPLFMKIWNDTMVVTGNLNRKDSVFKRGTLITSINGMENRKIIERMFSYLPEDGYANNINYIRLSANFPYFHRNIFGLSRKYTVTYLDSTGVEKTDTIPLYGTTTDSLKKDSLVKREKRTVPKEKKLQQYRSLSIDSSGKFAVMTLNTFSRGRLNSFIRRSFRELRRQNISNLVLDLRSNGGGRVSLSTLLTKYITRRPFRVADTLFSRTNSLKPYTRYVKGKFFNNIELYFISRKSADGLYHMRHMEKKTYRPRQVNGFKGDVYVLTNGPTFSAATLFCNAVKGQPGITLVGEETGGGWYGNNGILIPDIVLPHTKTRVRLPLFRVVQYKHIAEKGTGVTPDVFIPTSYEALLKGYDKKMETVKKLIMEKNR